MIILFLHPSLRATFPVLFDRFHFFWFRRFQTSTGKGGTALLSTLTILVNSLLQDRCHPDIVPVLVEGQFIAHSKAWHPTDSSRLYIASSGVELCRFYRFIKAYCLLGSKITWFWYSRWLRSSGSCHPSISLLQAR